MIYWNTKAQLFYRGLHLHDKYGPVVRIAPDELSYITDTAWKTIYGHRPAEMPKSLRGRGHFKPDSGVHGILTAPLKSNHSRMRRSILPTFSDKALRSQETFVHTYVDDLVSNLKICALEKEPIDIQGYYNFTTFKYHWRPGVRRVLQLPERI